MPDIWSTEESEAGVALGAVGGLARCDLLFSARSYLLFWPEALPYPYFLK